MADRFVLWGEPGSGSFSVEAVLAMAGAAVELVDLDLRADAQREPAFLAINPAGRVPALRLPEGEVLTESVAILLHLAERFPRLGLAPPAGSLAKARLLRLLLFLAAEIYPVITLEDFPERATPDGREAAAVREQALAQLEARWPIAEAHLVAGPWALGDALSLADLALAGMSRWSIRPEWRAARLPKIEAIAGAVAALPGVAPVWRRHFLKSG
jgi:GST-like protein